MMTDVRVALLSLSENVNPESGENREVWLVGLVS